MGQEDRCDKELVWAWQRYNKCIQNFVGESLEQKPFVRPKKWEDNTKMDVTGLRTCIYNCVGHPVLLQKSCSVEKCVTNQYLIYGGLKVCENFMRDHEPMKFQKQ